jgi:hypothetical protein
MTSRRAAELVALILAALVGTFAPAAVGATAVEMLSTTATKAAPYRYDGLAASHVDVYTPDGAAGAAPQLSSVREGSAATAASAAQASTTPPARNVATEAGVRSLAGAGDELAQGGVYALRDPVTGQVVRTGRTNNLLRRQGEHFRDPALSDFEFEVVARTDVYAQQRGLEKLVHDAYSPALNRINPISPTNPNRGVYLDAAERFLAQYGAG